MLCSHKMGSVQELQSLLLKRDERIAQLEGLLNRKEQDIIELKSQLDKYQSVFSFQTMGNSKKNMNSRRKQRAQGISAEPQNFRTIQDLSSLSQQKFPEFPKNDRSVPHCHYHHGQ